MNAKTKALIIFDEHRPIDHVGVVIRTKAIMLPQESVLIILVWLIFLNEYRETRLPLETRKHVEFMTNEAMGIRMAIQDSDAIYAALAPDTEFEVSVRSYIQEWVAHSPHGDDIAKLAYTEALETMQKKWSNLA